MSLHINLKRKLLLLLVAFAGVYIYFKYTVKTEPIVPDRSLLENVTIVTASYDDYSELWEPHYKLLFKNWPQLKKENSFIPVMLVTNELEYDDPRVISLKSRKRYNMVK